MSESLYRAALHEQVPYQSVGAFAFAAEHDWPALQDEVRAEEAAWGIQGDFEGCRHAAQATAKQWPELLEAINADSCLGCRNVACRIVMLIEDLVLLASAHLERDSGAA